MIHTPRPYQEKDIVNLREAATNYRTVLFSSATGSGKSFIFSYITSSAASKGSVIWVIVPLTLLIEQTSRHFRKWQIPHGLISSGHKESRAYNVHIVSKQTIERRWDKIKVWPDLILVDEAHVNFDFQIELLSRIPEHTKIIGLTATEERLDGRGLSNIYQSLVKSTATIPDLVEMGYLSPVRYFSPPLEGIETLHKRGTDVDAKELEQLFKNRAVYGNAIDQWRKYSLNKPTIAYCRNVKAAKEWASRFREAGHHFESIDGKMKKGLRRKLIDALTAGEITGLTSVDLIAYGFDCPRIEAILKLRPTESKALDSQMNGRGMRIFPGKKCVIIHDFVHNFRKHGHPYSPYEWNFYGKEKKKKKGDHADVLKLCPSCWEYFTGSSCPCGAVRKRKPSNIIEIDGRLIEQEAPIKLNDRPQEERREYHEKMQSAKDAYLESIKSGRIDHAPIKQMLAIAEELGRAVMWVYHKMNHLEKVINIPLLKAIADIKGYKPGWVWMQKNKIRGEK